jgi:hypothetical protein
VAAFAPDKQPAPAPTSFASWSRDDIKREKVTPADHKEKKKEKKKKKEKEYDDDENYSRCDDEYKNKRCQENLEENSTKIKEFEKYYKEIFGHKVKNTIIIKNYYNKKVSNTCDDDDEFIIRKNYKCNGDDDDSFETGKLKTSKRKKVSISRF